MLKETRRNDPCPCGSGAKYKNCCQHKETWRDNRFLTGAGLAIVVLLAILFIGLALSRGGDESRQDCPPGQVWSEEHGHCH